MPTPKKTTRSTARSKRTKEDLENEIEELKSRFEGSEDLTPEAETASRARAAQVRETVSHLTVDTIAQNAAKFTVDVSRTIANLTEQATAKADELAALKEAVALEEKELENLYGLEVGAASIKALIQEHEDKKKQFEAEIQAIRKSWEEEDTAHRKAIAQRNADNEQARKREQEEYNYRVKVERAQANDEFEQTKLKRQREFDDKLQAAEKDLNERIAVIAKQEADIEAMRTRIAGLDAEFEERSKKDVGAAVGAATAAVKNQFALERKDLEAQLALERQKNAALEQASVKMAEQVAVLTKQLEAAKQQVTDITVKALESSSGQQALQKMTEFVKDTSGPNGGRGGKA